MSSTRQNFSNSKFGINQTTSSKVMSKKLTFCRLKVNFLAITFESLVQLISNFACGTICRIDDMFAKTVFKNKAHKVVYILEVGILRYKWIHHILLLLHF